MSRSESRACVTGGDLNFVVGTRATLTTVRRFHPEAARYCFTPASQVVEVQRALGELATVLAIPRTLRGVPEAWMPSYARVFIPDLVREDVVTWIDSDAILVAPIDRLWEVPPGTVNVVKDIAALRRMVKESKWPDYCRLFAGIEDTSWAFNAGVFAFRPSEWVGLDATFEDSTEVISQAAIPFIADQLILNGLFRAHLRWLPSEYNVHGFGEESLGIPRGVRVLHYAGPLKPWRADFPKATWAMYYWEKYGLALDPAATTLRWLHVRLTLPLRLGRRTGRKVRYLLGLSIDER